MRCPVCSGTSDPAAPCPQCDGSGVVRCSVCNGSGEEPAEASRPQPSVAADEETVALPWDTARIVEVVNIAWQHHHPSLELQSRANVEKARASQLTAEANLLRDRASVLTAGNG